MARGESVLPRENVPLPERGKASGIYSKPADVEVSLDANLLLAYCDRIGGFPSGGEPVPRDFTK